VIHSKSYTVVFSSQRQGIKRSKFSPKTHLYLIISLFHSHSKVFCLYHRKRIKSFQCQKLKVNCWWRYATLFNIFFWFFVQYADCITLFGLLTWNWMHLEVELQRPCWLYLESLRFSLDFLKVVTNEKQGGLGGWQIKGIGFRPW
jgi:hypothetical protein